MNPSLKKISNNTLNALQSSKLNVSINADSDEGKGGQNDDNLLKKLSSMESDETHSLVDEAGLAFDAAPQSCLETEGNKVTVSQDKPLDTPKSLRQRRRHGGAHRNKSKVGHHKYTGVNTSYSENRNLAS